MLQNIKSRYAILFLICFSACLEEEDVRRDYPVMSTGEVTEITALGVTLNGTIAYKKLGAIREHGFVWGPDSTLNLETSQFSRLGAPTSLSFTTTVRSGLSITSTYYVRSYAEVDSKLVYGNIVRFKNLGTEGPMDITFSPEITSLGDTITISGRNFIARAESNQVAIDNQPSKVIAATDSTLTTIVPLALPKISNVVKVTISDRTATAPKQLQITRPNVTKIINQSFTLCDTIIFQGTNLTSLGKTKIKLNNEDTVRIISISSNEIKAVPVKSPPSVSYPYFTNSFVTSYINTPLFFASPQVLSVDPPYYWPGETVRLIGKNFPACAPITASVTDYTTGELKTYTAEILSQSATDITLKINDNGDCLSGFRISIYGKGGNTSTPPLMFAPPEILSVEPNTGAFGDEVTIRGNRLYGGDINQTFVNFLELTEVAENEYKGIVKSAPGMNGVTTVEVQSCGSYGYLESGFTFEPPQIFFITPQPVTSYNETIVINGKDFSPMVSVMAGGAYVGTEATATQIYLSASSLIPTQGVSYSSTVDVEVDTETGYHLISPQQITIDYKSKWTQLDYPSVGSVSGISFSLDGKGYAGYGTVSGSLQNEFYEFDPTAGVWTQLTNMSSPKSAMRSTATKTKGYAGLASGSNAWMEFDPVTKSWAAKADFPGDATKSRFVFADDNFVYASYNTSLTSNQPLWKYDPSMDQWTQITTVPGKFWAEPTAYSFNGKLYLYGNNDAGGYREFVYDPNNNIWQANVVNSFSTTNQWKTFVLDNYVITYNDNPPPTQHHPNLSNRFYKIIPGQSSWTSLFYYGPRRGGCIGFAIDNMIYMGLGYNGSTINADFWSFDDSKY
jgi:hypothetical protein